MKFEREDWTSFRTVEGLQQKAGVPAGSLAATVLKELVDNALDTGAQARVGALPGGGGYFIEDDGPGIDGTPEDIARLFSINRPMISAKLLRLPWARGALGNGLRVVAGCVYASGGHLVVTTRNQRIVLKPEHDGSTAVVGVTPAKQPVGTRIEIALGPAIPEDATALRWAVGALQMAHGSSYGGKSSPWWYDVPHFHELLLASGDRPVRDLVAQLDGCTGARAGEIVAEAGLGRMACSKVNREQAAKLLEVARSKAKKVNPKRLGAVGPELLPGGAYAVASGVASFGTAPAAAIPFVVEAWAEEVRHEDTGTSLYANVNRTPITGRIYAARDKRHINFFGGGLRNTVTEAPKDKQFCIYLNITTPYMPITSDGKMPNLAPFLGSIAEAVEKAVRKAIEPKAVNGVSIKSVVNSTSISTTPSPHRAGSLSRERQLFLVRPIVLDATGGKELTLTNWKKIIGDHEHEHGDVPMMYHPPRGSITHPHRDESIPLGTLSVQSYERPEWLFNKLLFIEKEGATEALKQDHWPERHDCMVLPRRWASRPERRKT